MKELFVAAKYENKWAVFDKTSRTFSHIGKGKIFCEKKARELNNDLDAIFNDPLLAWVNEESVKKMTEVVRDVFGDISKNEISATLEAFWEREDTPETLYEKLMKIKVV